MVGSGQYIVRLPIVINCHIERVQKHNDIACEDNEEYPLVILVGGLSSRLFALLGWPVFLEKQKLILGTKILSQIGRSGNLLDIAVRRFPGRETYIVCPAGSGELFERAREGYPHVKVLMEPGEGGGTGGAIRYALEQLIDAPLVDVIYGDTFVSYIDVFSRVLLKNQQQLLRSNAVMSMILLEQNSFDPQLGYCEWDHTTKNVRRLIEKPTQAEQVKGMLVNPALYSIKPLPLLEKLKPFQLPEAYSFEQRAVPALCSKNQVLGLLSHYLRWCDLGTPISFAKHRFSHVDGENRLGTLAGMRRTENCIVHSCVPWICVWAEDISNYLVSIIPLGSSDEPELSALIVAPIEWCEDPRKLANLVKTFRELALSTSEDNEFRCWSENGGALKTEAVRNSKQHVPLPNLKILKPSHINVALHYSNDLDLPQLTVTSTRK